ncbi:MAG: hypothetical protein AB8B93_17575 [Pseudomonadales bacterium]
MPDQKCTTEPVHPRKSARTIAALTLLIAIGGCTAFEGVNVGANIPIGGIGGVGVNKTIGQGQRTQAPTASTEPQASEESPETAEQTDTPAND